MADGGVCPLPDAMRLAGSAAVDVFAYKVMKSGGLTACRQIAGLAEAAGIASYGGTFLESSIGTSAGLQVAAAERSVTFGSEFIGGIWLADEIVTEPLVYQIGRTQCRERVCQYVLFSMGAVTLINK